MTSTLALKKSDFESEVGDRLGWGRGTNPTWTDIKKTRIQMDVATGLRNFYFCGHPWSFLKPTATLTLPIGTSGVLTTLALPDDFNGVDGGTRVTVTQASDGLGRFVLDFVGAGRVIQMHALTTTATGIPRMIAMRPIKAIAAGKMQRSELLIYPIPEQVYQLSFPYLICPDYLVDITQPYAYGGVEHHETIMACCLAASELRRDNTKGPFGMEADLALRRSIALDRQRNPTKAGYNRDLSDRVATGPLGEIWTPWGGHGWNASQGVEIDGITYT